MNSFYSKTELKQIGFKSVGEDVLISRKASIYGPEKMTIGEHVRIDDFCILSGEISIGNYIHIAAYSALFAGSVGMEVEDCSGISSQVVLYSSSDDYSGDYLFGPICPDKYRKLSDEIVLVLCSFLLFFRTVYLEYVTASKVLPLISFCGLYILVSNVRILYKTIAAFISH